MCVTDIPPFHRDSAAFVAIEAGGELIKLIYIWARDPTAFADTLTPRFDKAFGRAAIVRGDTLLWYSDSLEVKVIPRPAVLLGQPQIEVRSLAGCRWVQARLRDVMGATEGSHCWNPD